MKRAVFILVLLAWLLAAAKPQTAKSQSLSIQLGDKLVVIPAPDGFEEAASQFESIKTRMTAFEDPGNDMLAVHLPVEDCERLRHGEVGSMTFYTKVSVQKASRTKVETADDFSVLVSEFKKTGASVLDINSPRMKAAVERLDKTLSEIANSDTKLELSQPVNLGEIDTRPNVYSVLLSLNYTYEENGQRRAKPILGGLSFVRINQRLLYFYTYRAYTSKTDIEVLQDFTKKWISKILAAN